MKTLRIWFELDFPPGRSPRATSTHHHAQLAARLVPKIAPTMSNTGMAYTTGNKKLTNYPSPGGHSVSDIERKEPSLRERHTVIAALAVKLHPRTHQPNLPISSCVAGYPYSSTVCRSALWYGGSSSLLSPDGAVPSPSPWPSSDPDEERPVSAEASVRGIAR